MGWRLSDVHPPGSPNSDTLPNLGTVSMPCAPLWLWTPGQRGLVRGQNSAQPPDPRDLSSPPSSWSGPHPTVRNAEREAGCSPVSSLPFNCRGRALRSAPWGLTPTWVKPDVLCRALVTVRETHLPTREERLQGDLGACLLVGRVGVRTLEHRQDPLSPPTPKWPKWERNPKKRDYMYMYSWSILLYSRN